MHAHTLAHTRTHATHAHARTYTQAGQMMTLAGNYQEAEPLMRETLELAREAMGARSGAAASCVNNLAEVRSTF